MVLKDIARAKVNLSLHVLGKLPNGYHALESLVVFADFGDELLLDPDQPLSVDVTGPFATAIDSENLVARTAAAVTKAAPGAKLGRFVIDKQIPVAAGLGGGSADAAAALRLLRRLNPDIANCVDWTAIATSIGADVPACLAASPVMAWGYGERLLSVERWPTLRAVLVNPMEPVPADKTRQVFTALGAKPLARAPEAPPLPLDANPQHWLAAHANGLETAALRLLPGAERAQQAMNQQAGCKLARMSGAGPTWFGIFDDVAAARTAAHVISAAHPSWWVRPCCLN